MVVTPNDIFRFKTTAYVVEIGLGEEGRVTPPDEAITARSHWMKHSWQSLFMK